MFKDPINVFAIRLFNSLKLLISYNRRHVLLIICQEFSSIQFSHSVVSNSFRPHGLQHASLSITNSGSLLKLMSIESVIPSHSLSSPSPPAFNLSQHQGLFTWVGSLHQVARILELHLQHQSFQWILRTDFLQDGLVCNPCSPRNSQESSATPQFRSISSLTLSFLYGPTLISIHDY